MRKKKCLQQWFQNFAFYVPPVILQKKKNRRSFRIKANHFIQISFFKFCGYTVILTQSSLKCTQEIDAVTEIVTESGA
jgi:hypothetical protein